MTELRNYTCWEFPAHVTFLWDSMSRFRPISSEFNKATHTSEILMRAARSSMMLNFTPLPWNCKFVQGKRVGILQFTELSNDHSSLEKKSNPCISKTYIHIHSASKTCASSISPLLGSTANVILISSLVYKLLISTETLPTPYLHQLIPRFHVISPCLWQRYPWLGSLHGQTHSLTPNIHGCYYELEDFTNQNLPPQQQQINMFPNEIYPRWQWTSTCDLASTFASWYIYESSLYPSHPLRLPDQWRRHSPVWCWTDAQRSPSVDKMDPCTLCFPGS